MIEKDNSFINNMKVNFDNAKSILKWFMMHNKDFRDNSINETIVKLHTLVTFPDGLKCRLLPPKPNKTYPDLLERYVHLSPFDPCSYRRVIRELLLAGTKIAELDVTAESVYIFARYITKDSDLLCAYMDTDIYTILPDKTRSEQKVLMNTWLDGGFNERIPYNEIFPVTAEYLRKNGKWEDGSYKRNSGIFRDIETRNLMHICNICGKKILGHLHDAVYTTIGGFKDASAAYKEVYGNGIKFKCMNFTSVQDDVAEKMEKIEWKDSSLLSDSQFEQMQSLRDKLCIMREGHAGMIKGLYLGDECPDEVTKAVAAYRICNGKPLI